MWLVPCETAAVSVHVLCTPYSHVPVHIIRAHKYCILNVELLQLDHQNVSKGVASYLHGLHTA